jgi:hypothetical protein
MRSELPGMSVGAPVSRAPDPQLHLMLCLLRDQLVELECQAQSLERLLLRHGELLSLAGSD